MRNVALAMDGPLREGVGVPIEVEYRDDGAGVRMTGRGVVTGAEIQAANAEVYTEERLRIQRYQLCDFTRVERFDVSGEEVRVLAAQDEAAARLNPGLIIVIVGERDVIFGLGRMWQALTSPSKLTTRVFRTVEEAEDWIRSELSG